MAVPKLSLGSLAERVPSGNADSPTSILLCTPRKTARTARGEVDLCPHSARRAGHAPGRTPRDELTTPRLSCYTAAEVEGTDGRMRSAFPVDAKRPTPCEHHTPGANPAKVVSPRAPENTTPRMVCIPVTPRVVSGGAISDVRAPSAGPAAPAKELLEVPRIHLEDLRVSVYGATLPGMSLAYVLARGGAAVTICDGRSDIIAAINSGNVEQVAESCDEILFDTLCAMITSFPSSENEVYAACSLDSAMFSDVVILAPPDMPKHEADFTCWWTSLVENVYEIGDMIEPGTLVLVCADLYSQQPKRIGEFVSVLASALESAFEESHKKKGFVSKDMFLAIMCPTPAAQTIMQFVNSLSRRIFGADDLSIAITRHLCQVMLPSCPRSRGDSSRANNRIRSFSEQTTERDDEDVPSRKAKESSDVMSSSWLKSIKFSHLDK